MLKIVLVRPSFGLQHFFGQWNCGHHDAAPNSNQAPLPVAAGRLRGGGDEVLADAAGRPLAAVAEDGRPRM